MRQATTRHCTIQCVGEKNASFCHCDEQGINGFMKTLDLYSDTSLSQQNTSDYAVSHHGVTVLRQNTRTINILSQNISICFALSSSRHIY